MIQLNEWFQQNTRRPLAIAAVMVLALWCSIVFASYLDVTKSQRTVFAQLLDVTSLALSQKNRVLIESVFQTVQTQNRSLSISVCQGEKTVLSSNLDQALKAIRKGKVEICGECPFYLQCGGDRNSAYAHSGNYLGLDPGCWLHAEKQETNQNPKEDLVK